MTTGGTFSSGAAPILATIGGPIGIATTAASPALIAGGIVATGHGIVLHRNYDNLNKLDIPDGKGGINISSGNKKEGLEHIMMRHKFNSKELNVSKFNKDMNKYDIKRLIQEGWKNGQKKHITTIHGRQEWNINMKKPIGFGGHGQKTKMLKVIIEEKSKQVITAYPF
jgi:hypothetical protein